MWGSKARDMSGTRVWKTREACEPQEPVGHKTSEAWEHIRDKVRGTRAHKEQDTRDTRHEGQGKWETRARVHKTRSLADSKNTILAKPRSCKIEVIFGHYYLIMCSESSTRISNYKQKIMRIFNYSQTCSNDHLYKTTTRLRRSVLSPPKQIPINSLLYKTTTCLTRPATTFFVSQMKKKTYLKRPPQNLPSEEMGNNHMETMHKK